MTIFAITYAAAKNYKNNTNLMSINQVFSSLIHLSL